MMQYKDFSGYILAGGKSSRMGRDKAFLEINGKTFLQNAVDILSPVCEGRVKVALNKEQTHFIEKLPEKLPFIFDIFEDRGPVGGIHAALKSCETKFAVVFAVDQPNVESMVIEKLAQMILKHDVDVVIPRHKSGSVQQLCAIFRVERACSLLEHLLADQDNSVSVLKLIESLNTIRYFELGASDEFFDNVNEPEDYRRIR